MNNDALPIPPNTNTNTNSSNNINEESSWFDSQCSFFSCFYLLGCFSLPCFDSKNTNTTIIPTIIKNIRTPVAQWMILQICTLLGFICSISVLASCKFINYKPYGHYGIFRREVYNANDGTYSQCQSYSHSNSSAIAAARMLGFLSTYFAGFILLSLLMYQCCFTKLMNQYEFFPIFKFIISPLMILCSILNLGTFSITRYSPSSSSEGTSSKQLMSSATAVIFAFLFYLISAIMLIYIPKLSDTNQFIKFDKLFATTSSHDNISTSTSTNSSDAGNVNNKHQMNNSNSPTLDHEKSQENMCNRHRYRYAQNDELEFDEENNIGSTKFMRHVHFNNDEYDDAEEAHAEYENRETKNKYITQQHGNIVESHSLHDNNNKPKNIEIHHESSDTNGGSTNTSIYQYSIPYESNSSDSFHYKVSHESSKNALKSDCSSSVRCNNNNNSKNNDNPKSVHSGISTLTDDFILLNKWKSKMQQHAENINNIDLSVLHVTVQDALTHNADATLRQAPSSSNESARDNAASVGIFGTGVFCSKPSEDPKVSEGFC